MSKKNKKQAALRALLAAHEARVLRATVAYAVPMKAPRKARKARAEVDVANPYAGYGGHRGCGMVGGDTYGK